MTAECDRVTELCGYTSGSMAEHEAAELEQHIHGCSCCRARLSEMLGVDCSETFESVSNSDLSSGHRQPAASQNTGWGEIFPQLPEGLSRYKPLRISGSGGGGIVWEAWDELMKRTVAVKLLGSERSSPSEVARFLREANVLSRLSHPNIVSVYDLTCHEGQLAIVMEYVSGRTLAEQIRTGPVPEREAISTLLTIAGALAHAHQNGVIHRDLKPSNILLRWRDVQDDSSPGLGDAELKVSDFGLARVMHEDALTQTGQRLGTPAYMAPEQIAGDVSAVGAGTDIYGAGAILYELLTGRPPFTASDPLVTMALITQNEPVSPRLLQPGLSREIELICLKCLARSPSHRYASATALLRDLEALLAGRPISARPIGPLRLVGRWAARNRALAVSAGLAIVSIAALVHLSVTFAWTQKRMRDDSVQMELRANQKAVAAEQAAKVAQTYAQTLRNQLRSTIADLEYVQHYLDGTGALSVTDGITAERRTIVMNTTLRAYQNYLEFVGLDKPLQTEDLRIAVRHAQLVKSLYPDRDVQPLLERIADCIRELTATDRADHEIRDAEILYYYSAARDHWDRGRPSISAECYLQAAELVGAAARNEPPGGPQHLILLRNESICLQAAATLYATLELHKNAIDTVLRVCRVREQIISLETSDNDDILGLIDARLILAGQHQRMQDTKAMELAVASALDIAQKLREQKPALAAGVDELLAKHRELLDNMPAFRTR